MSEMELSLFRQRSAEAMKQKARRGELFMTVAIGFVKTDDGRIEKDADRRVQDAIGLVFSKFAELQTVRQVLVWFRHESVLLPAVVQGRGERPIEWKAPVYHTLHHILRNPVYGGAYVYGRRGMRVTIEDGRKRIVSSPRPDQKDWDVLIKEHHEGYISWNRFERNQQLISDNANGKSYLGRGSIRGGEALLAGLFRCARCGKKLSVAYSNVGGPTQRYVCRGAFATMASPSCITFGGIKVDRVIAGEVIHRVQPLGVEAALSAIETSGHEQIEKRRQIENALQAAKFEVVRAQRQFDAVDPDNRLVAGELERRWNERLAAMRVIEEDLARLVSMPTQSLSPNDRERLLTLGRDLARAWDCNGATIETKKKIIRLLINEIIVDLVGDDITMIVHWQGGDHTRLQIKKNKGGQTRWVTDADVIDLVRALARHMPDHTIAAVLNRSGKATGRGNSWTRARVCSVRNQKEIAVYRDGERAERGEVTLFEASEALAISPSTIRRLIASRILKAAQVCKGAPWIILRADLERQDVRQEGQARRARRPASANPLQKTSNL